MTPRLLAFDLDGTLLVGEHLPEDNAVALREARDAGCVVVIATARWRQVATRIAEQVGVDGPVIACSGAQVHDRGRGVDIFDHRLPDDFTRELYALCDAERCVATVTIDDSTLLKLDGAPDPGLMGEEMRWVRSLQAEASGAPRIAAIQGTRANARIRAELEPKFSDRVNFIDSIGPTGRIIITLTHRAATKGAALQAACRACGVDPADAVAFGDSDNDLAMFAAAGRSVAMGQATAEVQAAATWVSKPHDRGGVAFAVRELLAGRWT